jgi:hypothetical protein
MRTLKREFLTRKNFCCFFAIIFAGILVTSCTAEELPVAQDQEIIIPIDGGEVDGSVDGIPPVLGGSTYQPPKK